MQFSLRSMCPMPKPIHHPSAERQKPSRSATLCLHNTFFSPIFVFISSSRPSSRTSTPPFHHNLSLPNLNASRTLSTLRKASTLSLLTLSHLNLVCLALQILLVPALHAIHLGSPALGRTSEDLALGVSAAVGDADGLCGGGLGLGVDVVGGGWVERDSGVGC
jgi:hypothetical protein